MRSWVTYLFNISLLICLSGFFQAGNAQPTLGVIWDKPEDARLVSDELQLFSNLGVTHIELTHPASAEILSNLEQSDFSVLIRSGHRFATLQTLKRERDKLQESLNDLIESYQPYSRVAGFGLLSQSQFNNEEFGSEFNLLSESIRANTNRTLYYVLNGEWFSLGDNDTPFGLKVTDLEYKSGDLKVFDNHIQTLLAEGKDQITFVHSDWLIETVDQFPEFNKSLTAFNESGFWSLPLPHEKAPPPSPNWIVFGLLSLWIVLTAQFKFIPNARSMVLRYYFAHRFYVDDILHYRERYATQNIVMMSVHSIIGGIIAYVSAHMLLNDSGLNALFYHYPILAVTGPNYFSLFILTVVLILVVQVIAIFWLYLPAKNLGHISQTVNLYSGLLYTDYLVLTLIIPLYLTGTGKLLISIFAACFVLIWYVDFFVTALNTTRNLESERHSFILVTIGIYAVLSVSLLMLLLYRTNVVEVLRLSLSLQ